MIALAIGIALAGYFIGNGIKYMNNPSEEKNLFNDIDEMGDHELASEKDVHYLLGIKKEDAKKLLEEHPDIPHIMLNSNIYYPKAQLKEWVKKM